MFGRRSSPAPTDPTADSPQSDGDSAAPSAEQPKGRATPSRKDAEAQRKQTLNGPSYPKAARKAMKQREREARMEARAGLMAGDDRYLPARDQGPAKAFVRDYIDRKRRLSEYFIFIAVGILLVAFVRNPQVQNLVSLVWFVIAGVVLLEVVWVLFRLNKELAERWPEKSERKGCLLYAALRMLQIRRLRIPPPKVKPGGAPVEK